MTTKKLSSLKDFQDENLTLISKMQMATVVGGAGVATYGPGGATCSNANLTDTLKSVFHDIDGKQGTWMRNECIDELNNELQPGDYKSIE